MNLATTKVAFGMSILALSFLLPVSAPAQVASATLSGVVTGSAGAAVPNAKISVKDLASGHSTDATSDSTGAYQIPNLIPGDYQVFVSADGFNEKEAHVTLTPGAQQTLDFALTAGLSLGNLGFSTSETKGNAQEQKRLDKRSHMLQIHQRLGLITTFPLVATVIAGGFAGGHSTSSTNRDLHAALGSATAGLYIATAYYAIFAPKIPGTKTEGPIRLHKVLAWIHGPGMILTPVLGEMAFSQKSNGERVHGIAKLHGQVAIVTAAAYGLAILSVSIKSGAVSRSARRVADALGLRHSHSGDTDSGDATYASQ
jgi:hypothetical protein